jgi:hypothetical protein
MYFFKIKIWESIKLVPKSAWDKSKEIQRKLKECNIVQINIMQAEFK